MAFVKKFGVTALVVIAVMYAVNKFDFLKKIVYGV